MIPGILGIFFLIVTAAAETGRQGFAVFQYIDTGIQYRLANKYFSKLENK